MTKTHFGYKQVEMDSKQSFVDGVFSSVSGNYDVMNDVMSGGLHRVWKQKFVSQIPLFDNDVVLDLASGSGDIARLLYNKNRTIKLTASDVNPDMLQTAKKKFIDNNILNTEFKVVNAEGIDFPDNSVDCITISFGLRNVPDTKKALSEIYRVLKSGGRFYCMEFTPNPNKLYKFYNHSILPKMGKIIAKDEASYKYLAESIDMFHTADRLGELMNEAGFARSGFSKLTFGIVAIHSGFKL
jgi:demethylmenaquinone methyltransferase / 2-methoxy-6-polyprenyl-1,4-benzoquinol methylase